MTRRPIASRARDSIGSNASAYGVEGAVSGLARPPLRAAVSACRAARSTSRGCVRAPAVSSASRYVDSTLSVRSFVGSVA